MYLLYDYCGMYNIHYARPQHYPLNNDDHTRHAPWRYLFSMVLFVAEKSPQNAAPTREVCVFLTDRHPKTEKISR